MKEIQMAFKYRIYPTRKQKEIINKTIGCTRFVYNHYLDKRSKIYEEQKITFNYNDCSKDLTELKRELEWLQEVDKFALQNSLRDLDMAYKNFFRRIKQKEKPGYPRFKSKRDSQNSYRTNYTNNNIELKDGRIKLPKIGWVKLKQHRRLSGVIKNVTVNCTPTGKYYVSVCCDKVPLLEDNRSQEIIGVDVGLKDMIITSCGEVIENKKYYRKLEKKLVREQRRLSRKQKSSSNREKQRIKVAVVHEKISNSRKDYLHKISSRLINENQVICLEDLNIKGMIKNRHLAKSISDVSWGELVRQLKYKAVWHDKRIVIIDRFYPSSQVCSCCGFKNKTVKDLNVRKWACPSCGGQHDRDFNAAVNIRSEGLRLLDLNTDGMSEIYACGDFVRPVILGQKSLKQEAPELIQG